jgi:hypothetical protein
LHCKHIAKFVIDEGLEEVWNCDPNITNSSIKLYLDGSTFTVSGFRNILKATSNQESKKTFETSTVKRLLEFFNACLNTEEYTRDEIEEFLKREHFQTSYFAIACKLQCKSIVQLVIDEGLVEDLNHGKPNAFWSAVSTGNLEIVQLLSNVEDIDFKTAAPDGTTPLMVALGKGFKGITNVIVKLYLNEKDNSVFLQIFQFGKQSFLNQENKNSLQQFAVKNIDLLKAAILSDSNDSIEEAMKLTQIEALSADIIELAKSRNNIKLKHLLGLNVTPEPSTLLGLTKSFPAFNEKIEKPWEKPRIEDIENLKDLDRFILKDFCCIDKKSKSGLLLKESPNCSEDCQQ